VSSEATQRKVGWVRDAAGDRFDTLELGALVFAVEVTSDPLAAAEVLAARWDLTPAAVLSSPHLLVGTVSQIADELLSARERLGISYWVVQDLEPFAPVLDRLAGN
jgi:hypothetical protein